MEDEIAPPRLTINVSEIQPLNLERFFGYLTVPDQPTMNLRTVGGLRLQQQWQTANGLVWRDVENVAEI
jgi:hypothetical protein